MINVGAMRGGLNGTSRVEHMSSKLYNEKNVTNIFHKLSLEVFTE